MRSVIAAFLMWLGIASVPAAQTRPAACGSLPEDIDGLEDYAPYFYDDDMSEVRGEEIEQLAPTDSRYIVADSATCVRVHDQARAYLQSIGGGGVNLSSGEYDFAIFRYGPYYAIMMLNNEPEDATHAATGYGSLLVFRADDLTHLVTIAT